MAGNDHFDREEMDSAEAGCQAGSLKEALDQLASRIIDADRRHSATLQDLQDRLAALGDRAMAARAALPDRYAGAFGRIEDAIAALAERIRETEGDAHAPAAPAATVPHHQPVAPSAGAAAPAAEAVAQEAADAVRHAMGRFEAAPKAPPALRSAVAARNPGDWVRVEPPAAHSAHEEADEAAAHDAPAAAPEAGRHADADTPWEPQTAEALARHFDAGHTPAATHRDMSWPTHADAVEEPDDLAGLNLADVDAPARPASAQGVRAPLAAVTSAVPSIDRPWLEERLAEVAHRVEQSLADINPQNSFLALGDRFDQLEERFGTALEEVATRSDLEGLRAVEAQIGELFHHLDQTQAQLDRLDVIEKTLEGLRDRLLDDNLVRGAGEGGVSDHHLVAVAELAAEKVAATMADHLPIAGATSAADAPAFDQLSGMLAEYMSERRHGDAQAAEALDTLQQAMQALLDRLDAIEEAQASQIAHPAPAMAPRAAAAPAPGPHVAATAVREEPAIEDEPIFGRAQRATRAPATPEPQGASMVEEARAAARAASAALNAGSGGRPTLRVADDEVAGASAPATGTGSDDDRKAFIAMARRAAERAGAASDQPEPKAEPRSTHTSVLRNKLSGGEATLASRGVRPGILLVASVAAFLLAGYWMLSGSKFRSLMPGARSERHGPVMPAKAPAKRPAANPAAAPAAGAGEGPGIEKDAPDQPGTKGPARGPGAEEQQGDAAPQMEGSPLRTGALPAGEEADVIPGTAGRVVERGIALDAGSGRVDPFALARARQQVEVANASTRLGRDAVRTAPAFQTAAARELRDAIAPTAPGVMQPTSGARFVEMPPIAIGPLSLRLAASKGDKGAQLEVATRFAEGNGVPQDFAQAATWYQRAATQGSAIAQYRLAALYERGRGVGTDAGRARIWYKRAAEQGNVRAMHNLAVLSASPTAGSPDYTTALQWFAEAAKRGLADSQYNLGILYETGLGVPADRIEAYKWYALAARSGDKEAIRRRNLVASKLKPAERSRADALVISWRAAPIDPGANSPQGGTIAWSNRVQTH